MLNKNIGHFLNLYYFKSIFLHLFHFANVTHLHEKTKSLVNDGQLSEYFNISSLL